MICQNKNKNKNKKKHGKKKEEEKTYEVVLVQEKKIKSSHSTCKEKKKRKKKIKSQNEDDLTVYLHQTVLFGGYNNGPSDFRGSIGSSPRYSRVYRVPVGMDAAVHNWSVQLTPTQLIPSEYLPENDIDTLDGKLICTNAKTFMITTELSGTFLSATLIGNNSNSNKIPGTVIITGRIEPYYIGFNFIFQFTW